MGSKRNKPLIKQVPKNDSISKGKLDDIDYPVFSFKYLQDVSLASCRNHTFFVEFLQRLKKLCELGWKQIETSGRHSFGTEKLDVNKIIPMNRPAIMTRDVDFLTVFRATGSNHSFLGIRDDVLFHVIFIETNFGDIYKH